MQDNLSVQGEKSLENVATWTNKQKCTKISTMKCLKKCDISKNKLFYINNQWSFARQYSEKLQHEQLNKKAQKCLQWCA